MQVEVEVKKSMLSYHGWKVGKFECWKVEAL